jgi:GAF domain-containing protein
MGLTHFEMEQRLRKAGVAVRPYPMLDKGLAAGDAAAADRTLIAAGTAWENEVERLFAIQLQAEELSNYSRFGQLFDELCTGEGLSAALEVLNEGVPHRYTAIYRREGAKMINVALADKQREPRPDYLAEVPIGSSFCQYVLRDGSFLTGDSGLDKRLIGHPYQGVMLAYCGIPIFDSNGAAIGTACHFDVVSHEIAEEKVGQLRAVARILSNYMTSHSGQS